MTDLDVALAASPPEPETAVTLVPSKPRRHRHRWFRVFEDPEVPLRTCSVCGAYADEAASRRGRNNRKRGGRVELDVARTYGGEKTGPLGGPEDVRGKLFKLQVKSRQSRPPQFWAGIFAALDTQHDDRVPLLLLRFIDPSDARRRVDYFIVRGADWRALHGDEL